MRTLSRSTSRILALLLALIMLFTVTYRKSDAATTVSAKATLAYTLKNLKFGRAVQNFYIGSTYIYITQRKDGITYLSRLRMSGNTATYVDHMTLNNFGHGQSLDMYSYNNENWFYIGCKSDSSTSYYWSLQVARMKYEAGKTYDYTQMNRLSYMNYATKKTSSVGTTYRVAVGGNSTYTIFRIQTTGGTVTYSIYDTAALNKLLDKSKSVQMNTAAARACCKYYFTQSGSGIVRPNGSFQGIDMTGLSNIYVSGGAHGDTPQIAKMNSSGSYLKLFKITNVGALEIEGVQCKNGFIYFCIVPGTTSDLKKNSHKIYAIQESGTAPKLPTPAPTATPKPTVKPTATPTVKPTATPTVKPTATPTVKPTTAPTPTAVPAEAVFTIDQLAQAATSAVNSYVNGTPFYKNGITVNGTKIAQQNYYIMAAQAIQDIYNKKLTATYSAKDYDFKIPNLVANYTIENTDGTEATTASQALYMNFAIRQTAYVNGAGAGTVGASGEYPTTNTNANGFAVANYTGQMTYEAGLLMFSRVLASYAANGTLPSSVALQNVPAEGAETTVAPTTAAPTVKPTVAPTATAPETAPTAHPAFSEVASGTKFTVAEIAAAANEIIAHYDSYKSLETEYSVPKAVKVGNYMLTDQDWAYLAGYAVNGLSGAYSGSAQSGYTASTAVGYKKMGVANAVANNSYAGTTLTIAEVAEAAWKACSNYGNLNNRVAASCGSVPTLPENARQLSYYSILMAEARALNYYAANGSLPATVSFDALDFTTTDTDANESTETIAPVVTETPEATEPLPDEPLETDEPLPEEPVETDEPIPTEEPGSEEPDYTEEPVETEDPDATPVPENETYPRDNVLYAGYSTYRYITNNPGKLPPYSNIGGASVYMPELIGVFARAIVDANNGVDEDIPVNGVLENETIYEKLTEGALTKEQYVALAQEILIYTAENGVAPGYLNCDLGTISFNTLIAVFAEALSNLRSTGELPDTVSLTAWGSPLPVPPEEHASLLERESVLYAAENSITKYLATQNKYPKYTSIDGEQVFLPELIGVFAQLIVNENDDLDVPVSRNDATFAEKSYENITGTSLTKDQYVEAAQAVVDYINNSQSAAAPGFIETAAGTLSYETLIKVFAKVGTDLRNNGVLPETVEVSAWTVSALPTPPEATEAPELKYLNFLGILKGARRVAEAIEAAGNIPNYVTLDTDTRVLPGTMARLFASTVSNINRGKATDMPLEEITTPKNIVSETMTGGTFTKAQYTKVASRIASAIYENGAVPTYITTDIGTMNYANVIYLFSRVLEYYLTYGFLPDTIDANTWGTYDFQA